MREPKLAAHKPSFSSSKSVCVCVRLCVDSNIFKCFKWGTPYLLSQLPTPTYTLYGYAHVFTPLKSGKLTR